MSGSRSGSPSRSRSRSRSRRQSHSKSRSGSRSSTKFVEETDDEQAERTERAKQAEQAEGTDHASTSVTDPEAMNQQSLPNDSIDAGDTTDVSIEEEIIPPKNRVITLLEMSYLHILMFSF